MIIAPSIDEGRKWQNAGPSFDVWDSYVWADFVTGRRTDKII
jgi:hypothetical protein